MTSHDLTATQEYQKLVSYLDQKLRDGQLTLAESDQVCSKFNAVYCGNFELGKLEAGDPALEPVVRVGLYAMTTELLALKPAWRDELRGFGPVSRKATGRS